MFFKNSLCISVDLDFGNSCYRNNKCVSCSWLVTVSQTPAGGEGVQRYILKSRPQHELLTAIGYEDGCENCDPCQESNSQPCHNTA